MSQPSGHHHSEVETSLALAIDIGTSGIRGALYDGLGEEIRGTSVRSARNLLTKAEGGALTDADEAVEQIARTIDDVLVRHSPVAAQVEIIAISCFWHSLVGVDQNWKAVTPVIGWSDTRAAQAIGELQRRFDEIQVHGRTGCRFHPSYWPAKLLWLRTQNAELFSSAAHWVSLSEILMQRLFGNSVISVSMASGTGLLNLQSCKWDIELVSYLGLRVEQLPVISDDGCTFTGLLSPFAERWPQLQGARYFPAIGDGAANNIGAGCVTRDHAALMVGTSGAMRVMWPSPVPERVPPSLWCYRADRKRVIIGGALSDGGGLFGWMKEALNIQMSSDEIERALDEIQPDSHGLTLLPFWSGERSTGWHASASGSILGLKQGTQPIEILRAAMEAVAYRFALIAEALDEIVSKPTLVASGTALRSSLVWTQMIADVLGRPITLSGAHEASSRGAVLLAWQMEGRIHDIADAPIPLARTYEPDMARHALYREGLERQQKLYARLMT